VSTTHKTWAIISLLFATFFLGCSETTETPEEPEKDTTAPIVTATFPDSGATDVIRSGPFWVLFSEAMNEDKTEQATSASFTNYKYWSGDTLFIVPDEFLPENSMQNIIVTTSATDLAGNHLQSQCTINFTTTSEGDTTHPYVVSSYPSDGATNVPGTEPIRITFSEPMNRNVTESAISIYPEPDVIDFEWYGSEVEIRHSAFASSTYVSVAVAPHATDLAGNPLLTLHTFSFTTVEDNTRPYLVSASPAKGATGVSRNLSSVVLNFSESMDETSFSNVTGENIDARFTQLINEDPIFNSDYTSVTVPLSHTLLPGCRYWVNLTGITDVADNTIDPDPTPYYFTTTGIKTYYPVEEPNKWYFVRPGESEVFTEEIQNYNKSTGYFERVSKNEYGVIESIARYKIASGIIYHLGFTDYNDDGTPEFSMTWSDPVPYLKLPLDEHLGDTWPIDVGGTVEAGDGETYTLEFTGSVLIDPATWNILNDYLEGTFASCAKVNLNVDIKIYDGPDLVDEMIMEITDTYAPCVGLVKHIENNISEAERDTTCIVNWETK